MKEAYSVFYFISRVGHPFIRPFLELLYGSSNENYVLFEYSCAMKSHFRKFGNQMSGSGNHLYNYASLLA